MSASQDKKRRQAEREAGIDKRSVTEREAALKKKKSNRTWGITIAVLVIFAAIVLVLNSNLFYTGTKAVTIGEYSYTNAEYEYFYFSEYYRFTESNSAYLSMLLDTSKPLSKQTVLGDATKTWADYFKEAALKSMTQLTAQYDAAIKDGHKLSEENAKLIDTEIETLRENASYYQYKNLDKYIAEIYGRGCNEQTVRKMMEMRAIAAEYTKDKYDSFEYSAEDLKECYDQNKDTFDTYNYEFYYIAAEKVEAPVESPATSAAEPSVTAAPAVTAETMATAKKTAEAILASYQDKMSASENDSEENRSEAFKEAVSDASNGGTETARRDYSGGTAKSTDSNIFEWISESERKPGDIEIIESENFGYFVVLFNSRAENDYNTVSMRHILILAEDANGDGKTDADEIAAAKSEAEEIFAQWQDGEKTEESFAALANEKSKDPGSNTTGGLYENIYKGQMPALNTFLFDEARKQGDTAILFAEEGYTGYHIVYFSGEGGLYRDYLADTKLRNDAFSAWQTELIKDWTPQVNGFINWFAER